MARIIVLRPAIPFPKATLSGSGTVVSGGQPNAFTFTDVSDVALGSTQTSNTITVAGLGTGISVAVTVVGGSSSKNGGSFTTAAKTAVNGDTFAVRHTASATNNTPTNTTLTIGSGGSARSDTYTSVTLVDAGVSAFFTDSFASGNFNHTGGGFSWGSASNVSVVSNFGRSDNFSARFNFDNISEQLSELRYNLGAQYQEIWVRFYVYYPSGSESPSVGPQARRTVANNNKFFRIFSTPENRYPRYGASTEVTTPTGDVEFYGEAGIFPGTGTVSDISAHKPLVNSGTRGRWVKVEFHVKAATASVGGQHQCWLDDVQQWNITGIDAFENASFGFSSGYFMGAQDGPWANDGTFVYVDDVAFSTTGRV